MTVETEVANLTTAVDNLAAAVNVSKATLDAAKADAAASAATALTYQTGAQTAKTGAEAARDLAYGYQQSAASAVAYQDLSAIATSKAVTAVDVFVYDTSKDSDGGAWRKRTQHTSWYNETLNTATRGSRREFPAVAVIVAEASKVTIYDGDDPALPMWMVFENGSANLLFTSTASSVSFANALLSVGKIGALYTINFLSELMRYHVTINSGEYSGGIADRNGTGVVITNAHTQNIVSNTVNDVAMTVLPDAPIDPATGLPVPTIAVATDGGVSVIKDDGNVWDITFSGGWGNNITKVQAANENVYFQDSIYYWLKIPIKDVDKDRIVGNYPFDATTPFVQMQPNGTTFSSAAGVAFENSDIELAYSQGSTRTGFVAMTQDAVMRFDVTSTYNTGWMNGNIKGAFLSSTDTASLVGSGELVTNGTFDTDTSGWTASAGTFVSVLGEGVLISGTITYVYQAFSTVVGATYKATGTIVSLSGGAYRAIIKADNTTATSNTVTIRSSVGTGEIDFVATSTTTYIIVQLNGADPADTVTVDNISVKLADADRSVNNKGLIVNGTVTRSAVATGAELVGYSGFSASNYLEQPYNSALDFGTGDFCVMAWSKTAAVNDTIIERWAAGGVGARILVYIRSDGKPEFVVAGATSDSDTVTGSGAVNAGAWRHICALKRGTAMEIYVDGVMVANKATIASVGGFSNASAATRVGARLDGTQLHEGFLALLRISATAPTAEQIAKIYNDEKVLFQENAACTLHGTSDAVTALAHDPDTGILSVGTSAGRSDFQGLRRVANTTTAVATAISAANGMIVEQ